MKRYFVSVLVFVLGGCATTFTGSAYIEDGRPGCERKCAADGLAMSGLVYMGEYSSACVCEVRSAPQNAPQDTPKNAASSGASASAAAVGVIMSMREKEKQNDDSLMSLGSLQ